MKRLLFLSSIILGLCLESFAGWQIETVDSEGDLGRSSSIALDSSDHPHISYYDNTSRILKYASFDGSNWEVSIVDSSVDAGWNNSIALDGNDIPYIAYYDNTNHYLKCAYLDGSNWNITTVDGSFYVGSYNSIAFDNFNLPHIVYSDDYQHKIKYASFDGFDWQLSYVDYSNYSGIYCSLAFGSNNIPQICFYNYSDDDLYYSLYNGSYWQTSIIDSDGNVGSNCSIDIDSADHPHVAYHDTTNSDLKYASFNGSGWSTTTVDSYGSCGLYPDLALDSNDNPHISYCSGMDLLYAYKNGIAAWQLSVVDIDSLFNWTSIAIDSSNLPHLSYKSNDQDDLKYAFFLNDTDIKLCSFSTHSTAFSSIILNWQISTDGYSQILGFNLYRTLQDKTDKNNWTKLNNTPITGNNPYQFVDSTVFKGQNYTYRLTALTAAGREEILGNTNGAVHNIPTRFAFNAVYPNPAKTLVSCRLTLPQASPVTLNLYDVSGRMVLSKQVTLSEGEQEAALDVTGLSKGVYTVQANCGGENATKRIVVSK
jgi:hypothetical protein